MRHIASRLILITSAVMPFHAYTNACYFTLRSGGLTRLTMVYDCSFVWCVCIPLAFVLCRLTALPFVGCYAAVTATEGLKALFGYHLVKQGKWIRNIVEG